MLLQPDQHPVSVCKELLFFFVYCWEQASNLSDWIDGTGEGPTKVAGHATAAGAITFASLGAIAVLIFVSRKKLSFIAEWAKKRPIKATLLALPFAIPLATAILICLIKYLTFASALATTIGVLVALDNNNKSHKREENKFSRQAMAARSALALELSAISTYCIEVAKILGLVVASPDVARPHIVLASTALPEPPRGSATTLKEMITSTTHEHVAARCALLLNHLQIVNSNVDTLKRRQTIYSPGALAFIEMRIAFLSTINTSLYGFSRRGELELGLIDWEMLTMEADRLQFSTNFEFNDTLEHYRNQTSSPLEIFSNPMKVVFAEGKATVSPTERANETPVPKTPVPKTPVPKTPVPKTPVPKTPAPEAKAAVEPEPPASTPEAGPKPAVKKASAPKAATKAQAKPKAPAKSTTPKSSAAKAAEPEVLAQKARKPRTRRT